MTQNDPSRAVRNRLLSALPRDVFDHLTSRARSVNLKRGELLYEAEDKIEQCYFPANGMLSLLSVTSGGSSLEVAHIGEEGMVGAIALMGRNRSPVQVMIQADADCIVVEASRVAEVFESSKEFRTAVLLFSSVLMMQLSQTSLCNHFHSIESRACRWLSVLCDRSGLKHARLTQEFLAFILGVRRSTIGTVNGALQNAGLITYSRGIVEVHDPNRMRDMACECYRIVAAENRRLITSLKELTAG